MSTPPAVRAETSAEVAAAMPLDEGREPAAAAQPVCPATEAPPPTVEQAGPRNGSKVPLQILPPGRDYLRCAPFCCIGFQGAVRKSSGRRVHPGGQGMRGGWDPRISCDLGLLESRSTWRASSSSSSSSPLMGPPLRHPEGKRGRMAGERRRGLRQRRRRTRRGAPGRRIGTAEDWMCSRKSRWPGSHWRQAPVGQVA
eukprot:2172277-Pyramimonas_sp.AAC.2